MGLSVLICKLYMIKKTEKPKEKCKLILKILNEIENHLLTDRSYIFDK